MKHILMAQANDGTIFKTDAEAINHNKLIELKSWYEDNKLYGNYEGCRIEWEDLIEWISENKTKLRQITSFV